ncbi:EAL and HDOD domain-containing protein [Chitinilyticum litopenaei]|uniref:EAL and HDOD domain-containing protein n=1 Tax=Chitinilyticum litopenaei TaxID=1121276 RepID=UPI00041607AF|nr:EAL domain-containing protein [Chitinilyticum litopenaei]
MTTTLHIGRQPIVNRSGELFAYELLFRDSQINQATVIDDLAATSQVIRNAFSEFGVRHVLENHRGFINVSADLLMSDAIELLPPQAVVLEILETVALTPDLVARCAELVTRGFTLALDDVHHLAPEHLPILPHISFIKLDLQACTPAELAETMAAFRPYRLQMLAEKIDTEEQFAHCHALGFDLFQGYFFARPTILTSRQPRTPNWALLQLLGLLNQDADTRDLVRAFQPSPQLSFTLLKLVNSVACGAPCHIDSIEHALSLLGRRQLMRWVQLLLFTRNDTGLARQDPLTNLAVCRARLMELLCLQRHPGQRTLAEQAFMVGLLSLLEALYQEPLADLLAQMQLHAEIEAALLAGEGRLGELLGEVLLLERCEASGSIDARCAAASALLLDAMTWADQLLADSAQD